MRRTAARIRPARWVTSLAGMRSFILISRRALPSMIVSGVRNSCEAIETKLRCITDKCCSVASFSSSMEACCARPRWLIMSSMALR